MIFKNLNQEEINFVRECGEFENKIENCFIVNNPAFFILNLIQYLKNFIDIDNGFLKIKIDIRSLILSYFGDISYVDKRIVSEYLDKDKIRFRIFVFNKLLNNLKQINIDEISDPSDYRTKFFNSELVLNKKDVNNDIK